jgi:hypothetical protein
MASQSEVRVHDDVKFGANANFDYGKHCEKCGGEMRAVISAVGPHPGEPRWECSDPTCGATVLFPPSAKRFNATTPRDEEVSTTQVTSPVNSREKRGIAAQHSFCVSCSA